MSARKQRILLTDVTVTDRNGAYVTGSVKGQRASSTHSAESAVQRLAGKLYPGIATEVRLVPTMGVGKTTWQIVHAASAAPAVATPKGA